MRVWHIEAVLWGESCEILETIFDVQDDVMVSPSMLGM